MKKMIRVFLFVALFVCALSGTASALEGMKTGEVKKEEAEEVKTLVFFSENGAEQKAYKTSAITVEDFLLERNITLSEYDHVTPDGYELLTDNMKINYIKAIPVYVRIDDVAGNIKKIMTPPVNVYEFVKEYSKQTGMEYSYERSISGQICKENMLIDMYTKRSESFTITKPISYETQYVDSPEINEGVEMELIAGVDGEFSTIMRIDYVGKNEVSRETVAERVTIEPVDRVVLKGTAKVVEIIETVEESIDATEAVTVTAQQEKAMKQDSDIEENVVKQDSVVEEKVVKQDSVVEEKVVKQDSVIKEKAVKQEKTAKAGSEILQYEKMFEMSATAYTADYESTGKRPGDKYFGITASGMKAQVGVVAVDPKVIPLGTKLYIEGYGYAVAGDTGGAIKGHKIDLYFDTNWECKVYGRQKINVYVLKDE